MIKLILALDQNDLLGDSKKENGLPWYYPEDLKFFRDMTINELNVFGRKTYEKTKIKYLKKPIVITKKNLIDENIIVCHDIEKIIKLAETEEIMVCGGKEIFELFFPYAEIIYLTRINKKFNGDVYYHLDLSDFQLVEKTTKNDLDFLTYKKIK